MTDDQYEKLANLVIHAVNRDDLSLTSKGFNMYEVYERMNEDQRDAIDEMFVMVCGWKLDTLIELARHSSSEEG